MEARVLLLLFTLRCLLAAAGAADVTEPLGESRPAAAPGQERLHPQRADPLATCRRHDNLYEICRGFLQNVGNFDVQGKQFIKDFLKCSAIGIKSRFSSSVTRCAAVQRILVHVEEK
ncbi:stanniocalcin-1-like [Pristis pectinata]|uniref:stanniocalcin-1-like n=1 Tax=Pristis pectinata TaxID=685728 RepID=UPI00223DA60A|nr:stanniocalcin-1-like [Pristis pectinata]